jgi:hypothetical protein
VGKGSLLCPRPTDRFPMDPADPAGVDPFGPSRAESFSMDRYRGFTHGYSCSPASRDTERSNLVLVEPVAYPDDSYVKEDVKSQ